MTTERTHDSDRLPFWEVQPVFDPDGGGADFAYTIGLHTRGLPELHIWARPSLGADPGADWMLSVGDRCHVLNELGLMLVDGRLQVGAEVVREYDGGLTRVRYRVDPPGDRQELEALGVPEGVDVLPVRWSLHRAEEGPRTPLTGAAAEVAGALCAEITAGLDAGRKAPRGWTLDAEPSFEPDQRFGPLTPVVLARAAQLWQADDDTLATLARAASSVQYGYTLGHVFSVAAATARPCGRSAALAALRDAVEGLVEDLTLAPAAGRRWRSVVRSVDPTWWDRLDRAGRRRMEGSVAHLFHHATLACLSVEAVADVATPALLLEGRGPWIRGLSGDLLPAGPDWEASTHVIAAVAALLEPLDLGELGAVGRLHELAMTGRVEGLAQYPDLCARLLSWATVSAAVYPRRLLDGLPAWRALRRGVADAVVGAPKELHEWATCIASALTHRGRLSAEDVRLLTRLSTQQLPRLEEVLNSPV